MLSIQKKFADSRLDFSIYDPTQRGTLYKQTNRRKVSHEYYYTC